MEQVLKLTVVVFAAVATGGLMVNWIGLRGAMSRLSASTYVEFHQATNHTLDPYMPIVVVGALVFAPVRFDFTLSALFFHFQDWPATFLLVL